MDGNRYSEEQYRDALSAISAAGMGYDEKLRVCAATKAAGLAFEDLAQWARAAFGAGYDEGKTRAKWDSLKQEGGITAGTLVSMARERGWEPHPSDGAVQGWDEVLELPVGQPMPQSTPKASPTAGTGTPKQPSAMQSGQVQVRMIGSTTGWSEPTDPMPDVAGLTPAQQAAAWLEALFLPDETPVLAEVGTDERGKSVPTRCTCDKTAGDVAKALRGDPQAPVPCDIGGAWCSVNPCDGSGKKAKNVTAYRYTLVESDEIPLREQREALERLGLPIAALTYSGGKSLHAVVRVDAGDKDEYDERVRVLYAACDAAGLAVDRNNRNPNRYTRLPGALRGNAAQTLLALGIGCSTWKEWEGTQKDGLPPFSHLSTVIYDMPEKAPQLIEGVLRQGHKMMIAGPSKAGKSWCCLELSTCVAAGIPWMGYPTRKGKVLYVNFEIDEPSFEGRRLLVLDAVEKRARETGTEFDRDSVANNLDGWTLRGVNVDIDTLVGALVERCSIGIISLVILDPIYKVLEGDENSASDMRRFVNKLDELAEKTGASVVYAHHFPKGSSGAKDPIDRASGSGVFARDADAIITLNPLEPDGEAKDYAEQENVRPYRIEFNLREFKEPAPRDVWNRFPLFIPDYAGLLGKCAIKGSMLDASRKANSAKKEKNAAWHANVNAAIAKAVRELHEEQKAPTVDELHKKLCTEEGEPGKLITAANLKNWTRRTSNDWCEYKTNGRGVIERYNPEGGCMTDGDAPRKSA